MSKTTKDLIKEMVLSKSPPEAAITQVEFEGPRLALYTKNPKFLFEGTEYTSELARLVRKRIVLRTSASARTDKKIAENKIKELLPKECGFSSISFDPALGEVLLELEMPVVLEADDGALLKSRIMRNALHLFGILNIDGPRQLAVTAYCVHSFFGAYLARSDISHLQISSSLYPEIQVLN